MKRKLILMFIMLTFVCGGCGKSDVGTINGSQTSEETNQSDDLYSKELNAFENLVVTFEGFDGDGKIKIDTSNCSDKVKECVEFSYSGGVDGALYNNQELVISAKVKNEKYTLTEENQYYYVDGLFVLLEQTPMFHDGIAWLEYTDTTVDKTYLGAMDISGKLLFQYERNTLGKYTDFKDGKAMIAFAGAETVGIIDKTGKILKTIDINKNPIQGNKELDDAKYSLLELNDGYCFISAEVKDFDNNYYIYIVYDSNGECVLIDKSNDICYSVYNMGYDVFKLIGEDAKMLCYFLENNKVYDIDFSKLAWADRITGQFDDKGYTLLNNETLLNKDGNVIKVEFPFEDMRRWNIINFGSGKYILKNDYENRLAYYDVVSKKCVEASQYVEKIKGIGTFKNDTVFMSMKGADEKTYTAVFGEDWNVIIEPMQMSEYGYFESGFWIEPVGEYNRYYYDYSGNLLFKGNSHEFSDGVAYKENYKWVNTSNEVVISNIDSSEVITIEPFKIESEKSVYSLEGEYIGYTSTAFKINADGTMEYMQDGGTYPVAYTQKSDFVWNGEITWSNGRTTEIIIYMDNAGNLFVDGITETWIDEYYRRKG